VDHAVAVRIEPMAWVAALGVAWLALGTATAVVMARRGHAVPTWAVIGLVCGPAAPLLAVTAIDAERAAVPRVVERGRAAPGGVAVLVGVDGSAECLAALEAAVGLHHPNLGRLVLAVVVPYDDDDAASPSGLLRTATAAVAPLEPATVVLTGEPADALVRYVVDEGFDLLVVGARGRGRSSSPLGSVATRLAAGAPVPVLVGPGGRIRT